VKEFFRGELYTKYRAALTETIENKVHQLIQCDDDLDRMKALKAEIKTLVWVRDELPKSMIEPDPSAQSEYGKEYDGSPDAKDPTETGYENPAPATRATHVPAVQPLSESQRPGGTGAREQANRGS